MKNLQIPKFSILLLFTLFVFTSCTQSDALFIEETESSNLEAIIKVDLVNESNEKITTTNLKKQWESEIKDEEGLNVEFDNFEIIKSLNDDNLEIYFLKATSKNKSIETGAFIDYNVDSGQYTLRGKTCSCRGCSNGCNLLVFGSNCRCSSCPVGGSQACVKTETQEIDR